jgi:ADP-heptose:LPS heptosyltransferase
MLKTLIIRACAVGDFIFNLPALVGLQASTPMRFTLVGNRPNLDLARDFIAVDAVHSIDLQPWSRLFWEPLPGLEFDRAIVWMHDPTVSQNLAASGIPNVIRSDPFPAFGHASDQLLRTLGLPRPDLPDLWNPTSLDIVVHPSSGSRKKNWPFFDELMGRLPESRRLPEDQSLIDLQRYLRTVRGFVGNDSGITHLAAYLGVPTLALFGPTDPRTWGPIGRRARILWKTRLEDISVDEVLKVVHETDTRTRIDG